jgi:hypothetical protein
VGCAGCTHAASKQPCLDLSSCSFIVDCCTCEGLEVGDHLRSREELKRQWEEFQTRMEAKKAEQAVAQVRAELRHGPANSL